MPARTHSYSIEVSWTGNLGAGTADYRSYSRAHTVSIPGKPDIHGTSDPAFRGDPGRHSPEDLFVASVAACHMLWYLHLCADAGIVVSDYTDAAVGTMTESPGGAGAFQEIRLAPRVTVRGPVDVELAYRLHEAAHEKCFIANSVNFPVRCEATVIEESAGSGPISLASRRSIRER